MLDRCTIQKLRDLPIEGVAERLGLQVKNHKSLCPFHSDSHPSLTYSTKYNRYRCFVCDARGGTLELVMNHLGKSFFDACKWLADENNIILDSWQPAHKSSSSLSSSLPQIDVRHLESLTAHPVLNAEARRFLFDERKIKPEVVSQLGLSSISSPVPMSGDLNGSWFNAPSLLIPYRDVDGKLISVQARYLGKKEFMDKENPRFQFPRGSRCSIFNLPILKDLRDGEELWITEGVTDCLAMLSSGRRAIAIPSATLLNPSEAEMLKGLNLHIAPDQDSPGERLFVDLQQLCPTITRHQLPYGCKDFGQYWTETQNVNMLPC